MPGSNHVQDRNAVKFRGFARGACWYSHGVSWSLLLIPGALLLVSLILAGSAAMEGWILSPRSLIVSAARARRSPPEYTEAFVATQFERLLRHHQR